MTRKTRAYYRAFRTNRGEYVARIRAATPMEAKRTLYQLHKNILEDWPVGSDTYYQFQTHSTTWTL